MSSADQIARQLRGAFGQKRQIMQRVLLQGQRIAMREAPVKTGALRRAHHTRVENGGDRGIIGVGGVVKRYAAAVHNGRRAVTIRPVQKKALYWKGAKHPVKLVKQKARKGNPWLQRTAEQLRPIAAREFGALVNIR